MYAKESADVKTSTIVLSFFMLILAQRAAAFCDEQLGQVVPIIVVSTQWEPYAPETQETFVPREVENPKKERQEECNMGTPTWTRLPDDMPIGTEFAYIPYDNPSLF